MKRWYLAASIVVALCIPAVSFAQGGGNNGFGGGTGSTGGGGMGSGSGSTGLAGTANTTLLGNQVNVNFNSVFGTSATLANTTADNFAAYRPTGSGSGSGTGGGSFSGGSGITNSGFGSGTGGLGGTGAGGRTSAGTGGLSSGGISGSLGTGGAAGGLGGNRGGLGGGGLAGGGLGGGLGGMGGGLGNRNMMGGGNFGGGGFLGGGQGGFGMNNQQQNTAQGTMGYQVNFGGSGPVQGPVLNTNITPNVDFQQRLQASPGMQSASGLQVFTAGNTAILRGQVGSDYAKQLAAAMIRLEPGVYEVQNELVVAPPRQ